jgi:DNA-directed RNA polymerase subunit RPC12/RpoP
MATTCREPIEALAPVDAPPGHVWESPAAEETPASPADVSASRAPPVSAGPRYFCSICSQAIDEIPFTSWMRCPHCQHGLAIPTRVRAACLRCGHEHHIPVHELTNERLCATCGNELARPDVLLPARHRHHRHRRHRALRLRRTDRRTDAAWAVLIVGLTILICLFSLIAL